MVKHTGKMNCDLIFRCKNIFDFCCKLFNFSANYIMYPTSRQKRLHVGWFGTSVWRWSEEAHADPLQQSDLWGSRACDGSYQWRSLQQTTWCIGTVSQDYDGPLGTTNLWLARPRECKAFKKRVDASGLDLSHSPLHVQFVSDKQSHSPFSSENEHARTF